MCYLAVLDTDFISKAYRVKGILNKSLMECIMEMTGFSFFCHEKIKAELNEGAPEAYAWLNKEIKNQNVICYRDADLVTKLSQIYGENAWCVYRDFLNEACSTFSDNYFQELYPNLDGMVYTNNEHYVFDLQEMDKKCPYDRNLGEIKSYVLMQVFRFLDEQKEIVFCSDDKEARNGISNLNEDFAFSCMSIAASFEMMKQYHSWSLEEAHPYITSLDKFYAKYQHNPKPIFKVLNIDGDYQKIPIQKVLEDVFANKFTLQKNGELKYKKSE